MQRDRILLSQFKAVHLIEALRSLTSISTPPSRHSTWRKYAAGNITLAWGYGLKLLLYNTYIVHGFIVRYGRIQNRSLNGQFFKELLDLAASIA